MAEIFKGIKVIERAVVTIIVLGFLFWLLYTLQKSLELLMGHSLWCIAHQTEASVVSWLPLAQMKVPFIFTPSAVKLTSPFFCLSHGLFDNVWNQLATVISSWLWNFLSQKTLAPITSSHMEQRKSRSYPTEWSRGTRSWVISSHLMDYALMVELFGNMMCFITCF